MTSNRCFRDDEFLVPEEVTQGCDKIRIRIQAVENKQKLLPGVPFPQPSRRSEIKYEVHSYVVPEFDPTTR